MVKKPLNSAGILWHTQCCVRTMSASGRISGRLVSMSEATAIQPAHRTGAHRVGPYSRPPSLARLDQRTREARLLADTRAELTAHLGGAPSATQRALIDRAAWLTLRIALMDAKGADGHLSERDGREYLAWSNSLTRALVALGLQAATARPMTLAEHRARRDAESAAAAPSPVTATHAPAARPTAPATPADAA